VVMAKVYYLERLSKQHYQVLLVKQQ